MGLSCFEFNGLVSSVKLVVCSTKVIIIGNLKPMEKVIISIEKE